MAASRLGQNFLVNRELAARIAGLVPADDSPLLEIGPGRGALTEHLPALFPGRPMVLLEKDPGLAEKLSRRFDAGIPVLNQDVLDCDPGQLFPGRAVSLLGNLPYCFSREIIDWVLKHRASIRHGIFMVQREFLRKLGAGANARGGFFNTVFSLRSHFGVSPGSFVPPPKVFSEVFSFQPRPEIAADLSFDFYSFLKLAFSQRRKTLLNNLGRGFPPDRARQALADLGIAENCRAEHLPGPALLEIYRKLAD